MIPYSRPKLSNFYTLSQTKVLVNHTLHSSTHPYSLCIRVPPPPLCFLVRLLSKGTKSCGDLMTAIVMHPDSILGEGDRVNKGVGRVGGVKIRPFRPMNLPLNKHNWVGVGK